MNLVIPVELSTPIIEILILSIQQLLISLDFQRLFHQVKMLEDIMQSIQLAKIKCDLAKIGAKSISPIVARKAPTKDDTPESTRASPALPFFAIGYPSRVVIIAGSSPGI